MVGRKKDPKYFGLMAMYADAEDLILAAERTRDAGYRHIDAYTPFPVHGLADAVGVRKTRLPAIVFCGGLTGAIVGFAMQYIANVWHYPINIGGRPMNSWPAFITGETAWLMGAEDNIARCSFPSRSPRVVMRMPALGPTSCGRSRRGLSTPTSSLSMRRESRPLHETNLVRVSV